MTIGDADDEQREASKGRQARSGLGRPERAALGARAAQRDRLPARRDEEEQHPPCLVGEVTEGVGGSARGPSPARGRVLGCERQYARRHQLEAGASVSTPMTRHRWGAHSRRAAARRHARRARTPRPARDDQRRQRRHRRPHRPRRAHARRAPPPRRRRLGRARSRGLAGERPLRRPPPPPPQLCSAHAPERSTIDASRRCAWSMRFATRCNDPTTSANRSGAADSTDSINSIASRRIDSMRHSGSAATSTAYQGSNVCSGSLPVRPVGTGPVDARRTTGSTCQSQGTPFRPAHGGCEMTGTTDWRSLGFNDAEVEVLHSLRRGHDVFSLGDELAIWTQWGRELRTGALWTREELQAAWNARESRPHDR